MERLIRVVSDSGFGQIFITDTNRDHLDSIIASIDYPHRSWMVADGEFTPLQS